MNILKELEGLSLDTTKFMEKQIKTCNHKEDVCLTGILKITKKITKGGAPYYVLNIGDSTGSINCMAWNETPLFKLVDMSDNGKTVRAYGTVNIGTYTNLDIKQLQFIEETAEEIEEKEAETLGILTTANLRNKLNENVEKIISPFLKNIVTEALAIVDNNIDNTPFTEKTAYNYKGGLLHNIIDMCDMASSVSETINCGFYSESTIINEDLLLTGAILCNLGKTKTLTLESNIPIKTFDGQLDEDSIFSREIATLAVSKAMEKLPEEEKEEYVKLSKELLHMVASVKGNANFGALSTPRSKHAMILNNINNLVYTKGLFENLEKNEADVEFTKAYDNGKNYYLGSLME